MAVDSTVQNGGFDEALGGCARLWQSQAYCTVYCAAILFTTGDSHVGCTVSFTVNSNAELVLQSCSNVGLQCETPARLGSDMVQTVCCVVYYTGLYCGLYSRLHCGLYCGLCYDSTVDPIADPTVGPLVR